jgi:hypothetical protein
MKQTSIEWLEDIMMVNGFIIPLTLFEQARQMNQEQIEEAYNITYGFIDGREYYEKTYGSNN